MKDKKAVRRLGKVEAILSDIIERHTALELSTGDLLASAKSTVIRAKEALGTQPLPRKVKKASVKVEEELPKPEETKKPAPAVKKRKGGKLL